MSKITVQDLIDWEQENEEDVIFDGPYDITDNQWDEYGDLIYQKLNNKFNTSYKKTSDWASNMFDFPEWEIYHGDDGNIIILQSLADIINKYNIKQF